MKEHLPFHSPDWKCASGAGKTDKKDESSASILILGGKIHRGLCGVRADTEHVLLSSEKEQKEREGERERECLLLR